MLDEKRSEYFPNVAPENLWIEARQRSPKEAFDRGYCTRALADNFGNGLSNFFPLRLNSRVSSQGLLSGIGADHWTPNLSSAAKSYLEGLGVSGPEPLFFHVAAILHAPRYREANVGALRQDWPRIPLPTAVATLQASEALGESMAALLDPDAGVARVTLGETRLELRFLGVVRRVDGNAALNVASGDLALTAGWGHAGQGSVTMPGHGRVAERAYTPEELAALVDGAKALGLSPEVALELLGATTLDVHLNDVAHWRNIPSRVWKYTLGGYQVVRKWLSYRERALLGRDLRADEVRYVTEMVRRIAAILLLGPALDEN